MGVLLITIVVSVLMTEITKVGATGQSTQAIIQNNRQYSHVNDTDAGQDDPVVGTENETITGQYGVIKETGRNLNKSSNENSFDPTFIGNLTNFNISGEVILSHMNQTMNSCREWNIDDRQKEQLRSEKVLQAIYFVVSMILTPSIAIPGCVCNVFNVFILTRKNLRNSTHYYLTGLAVSDLIYLLLVIFRNTFRMVDQFDSALYQQLMMSLYAPILGYYFRICVSRISNVITMILSIERFVAVKFPLKAKISPLTRHPIKSIVAVYLFVTASMLHVAFRYQYALKKQECSNVVVLINAFTDHYIANKNLFEVLKVSIGLVTLRLIPIICICILNCWIILILNQSRKAMAASKVSNTHSGQQDDIRVARMLIAIATIFIICVSPGLVHALTTTFTSTFASGGRYHNLWKIFAVLAELLEVINASVNFIVYIVMSTKFRALCLKTMRSCGRGKAGRKMKDISRGARQHTLSTPT